MFCASVVSDGPFGVSAGSKAKTSGERADDFAPKATLSSLAFVPRASPAFSSPLSPPSVAAASRFVS